MEYLTGLIIGFLGSLHCIGMCGPIALALPSTNTAIRSFINGRVLYNSGRVFTYAALGLVFGLLGKGLYMYGFQQVVSILLGIIILFWLVLPSPAKNKLRSAAGLGGLTLRLKNLLVPLFKSSSALSMFLIGVLNGFLPCGFVYMGIAGAVAVSSVNPLNGMLFMVFFGLGTVPAMLGTSIAGNFINFNFKRKFAKFVPVFAVILAVIFMLRGMKLGIPYISPKLDMKKQVSSEEMHHH